MSYVRMLHSETTKWLELLELSLAHSAVHLFLRGLEGWLRGKDVPVLSLMLLSICCPSQTRRQTPTCFALFAGIRRGVNVCSGPGK